MNAMLNTVGYVENSHIGQRFFRPWEMRVTLGDTITSHKQTASKWTTVPTSSKE